MTEAEARARLERMVAHNTEPVLSIEDVDQLVDVAKLPDLDGLPPDDVDWVPTWNLSRAAKQGWEWKAGRTTGHFNFGADGQSFDREQVHAHCLAMVRHYSRSIGSVTLEAVYPLRGSDADGW